MEHKLSKHQLRMLVSLLKQKEEAKKTYEEIADAEQELLAMIIKYAELPIGAYMLKQEGDNIFLFSEDKPIPNENESKEG